MMMPIAIVHCCIYVLLAQRNLAKISAATFAKYELLLYSYSRRAVARRVLGGAQHPLREFPAPVLTLGFSTPIKHPHSAPPIHISEVTLN